MRFEDMTRAELIALLVANDPNGTWTDADTRAEGMEPITKEEAIETLERWSREADGDAAVYAGFYFVRCRVSGGVTGTREGLLRDFDGRVERFTERAAAEARAAALLALRERQREPLRYGLTVFEYWVVDQDEVTPAEAGLDAVAVPASFPSSPFAVEVWFATSAYYMTVARFDTREAAAREARRYTSDARGVKVTGPGGVDVIKAEAGS